MYAQNHLRNSSVICLVVFCNFSRLRYIETVQTFTKIVLIFINHYRAVNVGTEEDFDVFQWICAYVYICVMVMVLNELKKKQVCRKTYTSKSTLCFIGDHLNMCAPVIERLFGPMLYVIMLSGKWVGLSDCFSLVPSPNYYFNQGQIFTQDSNRNNNYIYRAL